MFTKHTKFQLLLTTIQIISISSNNVKVAHLRQSNDKGLKIADYDSSDKSSHLENSNEIIMENDRVDTSNNEKAIITTKPIIDTSFKSAFIASISVILVSEIGDKTFFIAAIMSAQYSRIVIFSAAMSALAIMTAMSAAMGNITTAFIKVEYTKFISNVLFVLFGLRSLKEGLNMSKTEDSEFKETDAELKEAAQKAEKDNISTDPETGLVQNNKKPSSLYGRCVAAFVSKIFLQAFTMTFLAEWGDRSQITTIILGTTNDPYGVTAGGCLGHFICTGCACIGGRIIAQKISVRNITLLGGTVFILFAIHGFYEMMW